MYSRPSSSITREPRPSRKKSGVPPTARKARTGEFTPPGIELLRALKELAAALCHGRSAPMPSKRLREGCARRARTSGASKSAEITASMSAPAASASAALSERDAADGDHRQAASGAPRRDASSGRAHAPAAWSPTRRRCRWPHSRRLAAAAARARGIGVARHADDRARQRRARLRRRSRRRGPRCTPSALDASGELDRVVHDERDAARAAQRARAARACSSASAGREPLSRGTARAPRRPRGSVLDARDEAARVGACRA